MRVEVVEVDGELAVIFPDAFLEKFDLRAGDTVIVTPTGQGYHVAPGQRMR